MDGPVTIAELRAVAYDTDGLMLDSLERRALARREQVAELGASTRARGRFTRASNGDGPGKVLEFVAAASGPVTSKEVQDGLGLTQPTVDKHLRALMTDRKLLRNGRAKPATYRPRVKLPDLDAAVAGRA